MHDDVLRGRFAVVEKAFIGADDLLYVLHLSNVHQHRILIKRPGSKRHADGQR